LTSNIRRLVRAIVRAYRGPYHTAPKGRANAARGLDRETIRAVLEDLAQAMREAED
jgi:hypothetical protein